MRRNHQKYGDESKKSCTSLFLKTKINRNRCRKWEYRKRELKDKSLIERSRFFNWNKPLGLFSIFWRQFQILLTSSKSLHTSIAAIILKLIICDVFTAFSRVTSCRKFKSSWITSTAFTSAVVITIPTAWWDFFLGVSTFYPKYHDEFVTSNSFVCLNGKSKTCFIFYAANRVTKMTVKLSVKQKFHIQVRFSASLYDILFASLLWYMSFYDG